MVIIPSIGKENLTKAQKTKKAMDDLAKALKAADIETLVVISSHAKMHLKTYGVLFAPEYKTNFKEFGDLETEMKFYPDAEIIEKIRHGMLDAGNGCTLIQDEALDWGFAVPLWSLVKDQKIKIVPMTHSFLDTKNHFETGQIIKKILLASNKRIGIIASGNLSHRSSEGSPAGFSVKGKEFNEKLKELIETKNAAGVLSMDKKLISEAKECLTHSLAVLLGIMDKINYNPEIYSMESPLGVGYMVCNLKIL